MKIKYLLFVVVVQCACCLLIFVGFLFAYLSDISILRYFAKVMKTLFSHLRFADREARGHVVNAIQMKIQQFVWTKEEMEYI